jgi:hypothetical protein
VTRRPFEPREVDADADLGTVADELHRYARLTESEVPHRLDERVMTALANEPLPRQARLGALFAPFALRPTGQLARTAMLAGTVALAVLAVVAAGEVGGLFRNDQVGPSPLPTTIESPFVSPTPSPSATPRSVVPSPSEVPTPSPVPTLTPQPTPTALPTLTRTPLPTVEATDLETPEAGDHSETPHPSDSGGSRSAEESG